MNSMYCGGKLVNSLPGTGVVTPMFGWPQLPALLPPRSPGLHGGEASPGPKPSQVSWTTLAVHNISSPALASSSFPGPQRRLRLPRRRETIEWRVPRSQNTLRSQNAARRARPLKISLVVSLVSPPLLPHPAGWET